MAISTVSFGNTPQAKDDYLLAGLTEDSTNIVCLDVMANDLGGNAKTLYSLDNGISGGVNNDLARPVDLLCQDTVRAENLSTDTSLNGAKIWITTDGKVKYDASTWTTAFRDQLNSLQAGQYLDDSFTYAIRLGNGTLSWATAYVRIGGSNDAPTISLADAAGAVTEDVGVVGGNLTDSGTITFDDLDLIDTHTTLVTPDGTNALGGVLTASVTDPATDVGGGTVTWTYTVANSATQYLAAGQTVDEKFTIEISDGHGGSVEQLVTVTVTGTNDAPVISLVSTDSDSATKTETDAGLTATGTLTVTDADLTDTVASTVTAISHTGPTGGLADAQLQAMLSVAPASGLGADPTDTHNLTWTFDSGSQAFDFLAAGETLTLTYTVTTDDGHPGGTATHAVTVTINGTNDAPDITVGAGDSASASLPETDAGLLASGTLTVTDADVSDTVMPSVVSVTTGGTMTGLVPDNDALKAFLSLTPGPIAADPGSAHNLSWAFDSGTEAFNYLAVGESLILTYTVRASDASTSDDQTVTITITGTNDAPDITVVGTDSDAASLPETDAGLLANGTLTVTDADVSDTVTPSVFSVAATGQTTGLVPDNDALKAFLSLTPGPIAADPGSVHNLGWSFDSGAEAFNYLAVGESLTLTYTVRASDDSGAANDSDDQTVTVTITGTNDAPDITVAGTDSDVETLVETNSGLSTSGTLTVTDADLSDAVAPSVEGVSLSGTTGGLAAADVLGMLTVSPPSIPANPGDAHNLGWAFNSGSQAFDFLADGESLVLTYTVRATDDSGAANNSDDQTVTVTITGTNDAPDITVAGTDSDVETLAETNSGLSTSGTLTVTDADLSDSVTPSVQNVGLSGTTGGLTAADVVGMLSVSPPSIGADPGSTHNLGWSFDSGTEAFNYLAVGESLVLTYTVRASDASTSDDQTVTITITGTNDAPVVTVGSGDSDAKTLAETNIPLATSGTLTVTDVDLSDAVTPSVHGVSLSGATGGLAAADVLGMLTVSPPSIPANPGDAHNLGWAFDSGTEAFNYLAVGESLVLTYTVRATDDSGAASDSDDQTVTITITGTNDAPVIAVVGTDSDAETLAEADSGLSTSGTLTVTDADVSDTVSSSVTGVLLGGTTGGLLPADVQTMLTVGPLSGLAANPGDTGNLSWTFNSGSQAFDFLAAGESLTLTYTITSSDGHSGSDTQDVTITITGTNDAPVVAATDVTGAVTELVVPAGDLTDTGTIAFTDVDLTDGHSIGLVTPSAGALGTLTASVLTDTTGTGAGGVIKWHYTVPASAVEYLAATETKVETFTFALSDGHGGSVNRTVDVTITGTNDAPDITVGAGDSAAETRSETNSPVVIAGTLTVTDVDLSNSVTPTVQSVALTGTTGTLTNAAALLMLSVSPPSIGADPGSTHNLNWAFNSGTEAFDYLAAGQSLVLAYTVRASDGTASDDQIVTITISGTNDAPTPPVIASVTDNISPLTGTFTTSGVTTNDTDLTVKVTLPADAVAGETIRLYDGTGTGSPLGSAHTLTASEIGAGFVNLQTGLLTNGTTYNLTARITDTASNQSDASNVFTVTEDTTAPTVTITGTALNGTPGPTSTSTVTFQFSETVTGFDLSDVAVSTSGGTPRGTWSNFAQVDGDTYTAVLTRTLNGSIKVDVAAGSYQDLAGNLGAAGSSANLPAGVAGEEINLALRDPTADASDLITFKVTGVPAGWTLNAGTLNADGSWTVSTTDPSALTVKSPSDYTGAVVLNVAASWTNADGSSGSMFIYDNVEVFAQGAPIFALSAEDHLTGSSGSDLFVFGQPISGDTLHNFDAVADKIDLIGFDGIGGFGDLAIADDGQGNAVVTLGANQTITILGVAAASLGADNFVFNVEPVMDNAGTMTIADGAIMPLGGTINNTGTIALGAADAGTELEVIVNGVTLQGGGHLTLSDDDNNLIFGGASDALLSNIDNIVSGAGQIGGGQMTLANAGTILADGTHALVIDTGANTVTNAGLLESTGSGGLIVSGNLANDGHIWANGGDVTIHGDVTGSGDATISGTARLDLDAGSHLDVLFADDNGQTLELDAADLFSGTVTGFGAGDVLDFADLGLGTTLEFAANADGTGGTLTLTDGAHAVAVDLAGNYQAGGFTASCQQGAGVLVTYDEAHIA